MSPDRQPPAVLVDKKALAMDKKALDARIGIRSANRTQRSKEGIQRMDKNSLAHTSWNCKYHIVFAPKYRRKVFYKEKREAVGKILRQLCEWKGVKIIEAEVCPDHVHMLVEIPPKIAVSSFMGYLKGKSGLMICGKYPELRYKCRNRELWCRDSRKECKEYRRIHLPPYTAAVLL